VVRVADRWTYWVLFGVQTLAASFLYWYGVPLYRTVLQGAAAYVPKPRPPLWAFASITLMQLGYWYSFRIRPPMPQLVQPVFGHAILCLARLGFILASGVFSLVFLAPRAGFSLPAGRSIITILGLFAVFCYTRELERLGCALLGQARSK
jgi:hypothetical protein